MNAEDRELVEVELPPEVAAEIKLCALWWRRTEESLLGEAWREYAKRHDAPYEGHQP